MDEFRIAWRKVERKTYLRGTLRGKYMGFLKKEMSDLTHENFYDIEILEAEIFVEKNDFRKWEQGEFQDFRFAELFVTKLPTHLPCSVNMGNGVFKSFAINLRDPKVFNIKLSEQLNEGLQIFGTIEGDISGYLFHTEMESYPEKIVYPQPTGTPGSLGVQGRGNTGNGWGGTNSGKDWNGNEDGINLKQQGDFEPQQDSKPKNEPLISNPKKSSPPEPPKSVWKAIGELLQIVAVLIFAIPLLYSFRYFIGIIAAWVAVYFLVVFVQPIIRFLGRLFIGALGISFVGLFFISLLNFLSNGRSVPIPAPVVSDSSSERTESDVIPGEQGIFDSVIIHHREWLDYDGRTYSGDISVKIADFRAASQFRNQVYFDFSSNAGYGNLVDLLYKNDQNKLSGVYQLLDSIRVVKKLNQKEFAEVIVSCIQDIPYTLILEDICSPWKYDDAFTKEYLLGGGRCRPFTKYGILTPVEFMTTLDGDCDTRSLLLYALLTHYEYDVLLLSSTYYRHAVIAINLPYPGIAKHYNGKRYVVWETTNTGLKPGVFSSQFSDMNYWTVTLPLTQN